MKPLLVAAVAVAATLHASRAVADGPLGPNGSDIRTSDYALDLAAGPILAGPRALGLGGAYVAVAEGIDGNGQNPASPAVRAAWSSTHFDWDAGLGLLFPSTLSGTDFFNTGRGRTDLRHGDQSEFLLLSPAANLQIGPWGVGLGLDLHRYGVQRRPDPALGGEDEIVRAQLSVVRTYLARAVDDGQLVGGLGFHVTALDVTTRDEIFTRGGNQFTTRGVNVEGGLLWRPNEQRFRVGLALRAPVITEVDARGEYVDGDVVLGDPSSPDALWMPKRVKRPWSSDFGFALSLGPRPLNPTWLDPVVLRRRVDRYLERREERRAARLEQAERLGQDQAALLAHELDAEAREDARYYAEQEQRLRRLLRERYDHLPRRYVLIAASLHADGAVGNAVGIESFIQRKVDRSGERVALSPRLGIETEAIERWLKLRGGSYLEPSRFRGTAPRLHGTAGFDVRLFEWSLFGLLDDHSPLRLSAAVDTARDYFGWAVAAGVWR